MFATNNQFIFNDARPTIRTNGYPYFAFVITNYPKLMQHTNVNRPPYQYSQQQQQQQQYHRAMFIPGVRIHAGNINPYNYEQMLYNTVRHQLEETIRTYLRLTRRSYPIYSVFDM